jgi:transposase
MAKMINISKKELDKSETILKKADASFLLAAAVKIVSRFSVPLKEALELLHLSKSTARRRWNEAFSDTPEPQKGGHGGRRREHLSVEDEKVFLDEWRDKALEGKVVTVAEMKEAFEARSGKTITDVGFYKLLHRHRWRKLKPDTKHPKANLDTQEDFKKKSVSSRREGSQGRGGARRAWIPGDVSR